MPTRRFVLTGAGAAVSALALQPFTAWPVRAQDRLPIRHGWDPEVEAPVDADVYVAPDGDDAGPGSRARPFRTIRRGVAALAERGQGSLAIRGGLYREAVNLTALQGQPGAGFRIHRYGRERVTVTAADVLTGWQPCPADEAGRLGLPPGKTHVVRLALADLAHEEPLALNLHEAGAWCPLATFRADPAMPEAVRDRGRFFPADIAVDDQDMIGALRDGRLRGLDPAHLAQARVLLHHRPNVVSLNRIARFDPATGTIIPERRDRRAHRGKDGVEGRYALQNFGPAMQPGQWIVRQDGDRVSVYFWPRDPSNLAGQIEISTRDYCFNLGLARHLELFGLEGIRASGRGQESGACLRRIGKSRTPPGEQALSIRHCRFGGMAGSVRGGYGGIYLRGADGVRLEAVSLGPARDAFGMFLTRCRNVDMRGLHIDGVGKSAARFFGLRNAVLAFSLMENCGWDAHANKFNFYEGSDQVLVYGVRTRNTGGYVTYQKASRIHFAFCEFDCAPGSQNRALVSQNHAAGGRSGGADGSGAPVAEGRFWYWNLTLAPRPRALDPANALQLGPGRSTQRHEVHNSIIHGGGLGDIYRRKADPMLEVRSHNLYTGLAFWQTPRYGWRADATEVIAPLPRRAPEGLRGRDMRATIARDIAPLFPGFTDWDRDIDGVRVNWGAPPLGCRV